MNKTLGIILLVLALIAIYAFTTRQNGEQVRNEEVKDEEMDSEQASKMTFFVTSSNPGTGANLGGLAGADLLCQNLATAAGAGDRVWRAYLSAVASGDEAAVNARDRIGSGPWHNFAGTLIANTLDELHSGNIISKATALSEKGEPINGRGDTPNVHDILTGSQPDGTVSVASGDTTCGNWTREDSEGSAVVGHHDRVGLDESDAAKSWNSSHLTRGCSLTNLNTTGGGGLLYCFAQE